MRSVIDAPWGPLSVFAHTRLHRLDHLAQLLYGLCLLNGAVVFDRRSTQFRMDGTTNTGREPGYLQESCVKTPSLTLNFIGLNALHELGEGRQDWLECVPQASQGT